MGLSRDMLNEMGLTPEYVNQIMVENGKSIQAEKNKAEKYRIDAEKVTELEKQLEEINNEKLSDIEKANKLNETANNRIAELEKTLKLMQQKKSLADIGIVGEDADNLIKEDGAIDFAVLGSIISKREKIASSLKEKEILNNTPNPQGGQGEVETDPVDLQNAKTLNFGNQVDNSTKDYYVIK